MMRSRGRILRLGGVLEAGTRRANAALHVDRHARL
jgi:hypothetical protein